MTGEQGRALRGTDRTCAIPLGSSSSSASFVLSACTGAGCGTSGSATDAGSGAQATHVLLFGGLTSDGTLLGDTWTWDGTGWTKHDVPGPSGRCYAVAAALDGRVVVYGGDAGDGTFTGAIVGETWVWDGSELESSSTSRDRARAPHKGAPSTATSSSTEAIATTPTA